MSGKAETDSTNDANARTGRANSLRPQWYSVQATYKAVHLGKRRRRHLWERTVFLIHATEQDKSVLAQQAAKDKEIEYLSANGDTVRWTLEAVEKIEEIMDRKLGHGTEVFSEFFERVDRSLA